MKLKLKTTGFRTHAFGCILQLSGEIVNLFIVDTSYVQNAPVLHLPRVHKSLAHHVPYSASRNANVSRIDTLQIRTIQQFWCRQDSA